MGAHRLPTVFTVGIAFACALLLPALCSAQENLDPETGLPKAVETGGCRDLNVPLRLPSSVIVSCDKGDSIEVTMPLNPDAQGYGREKLVRGVYEFREYQILEEPLRERAFENLVQLLGIAGFTVKYSSGASMVTARNMDTWILINVNGEFYDVKVVRAKEDPWTPAKDAQEISREMEAHHRVAVYGIEFSPDNQAVVDEHSKILGEVLKYLKGNPGSAVAVESHKISKNGNAEDDLEVTGKRAKAVAAWFDAHGIAPGRLQPKGLGRSKPITENDTPQEIQRNERIELATPTP
jgi:outer membrane protein OmpA-like peptidoglycan-associated protein